MFDINQIYYGIALSILDIIMETLCKLYTISINKTIVYIIGAIVSYSFVPFLFVKSLKYEGIAVMNLIWNLCSNLIITAIGVLYFKEPLLGTKWIGILLSIFSIGLLSYSK